MALGVGVLAFGGGFAIIARLRQRMVDELGWVTPDEFTELMAVTAALPGANASNLLAIVAAQKCGTAVGALAAVVFLAPGVLLMFAFGVYYERLRGIPALPGVLAGIAAAVVGLVAAVADDMRPNAVKTRRDVAVLVIAFALLATRTLGLVEVVVLAGLVGVARGAPRPPEQAGLFVLAGGGIATKSAGLFGVFAKISLATFGGGVAMIPAIEHELVGRGFVDPTTYVDAIALTQLTPGPIAVCASFLGYRAAGLSGAVTATLGVFGPPVALALFVARQLPRLDEWPRVRAFLRGVAIAVVAAVLAAALSVYRAGVHGPLLTACAVAVFIWRRRYPRHGTLWPLLAGAAVGALRDGLS